MFACRRAEGIYCFEITRDSDVLMATAVFSAFKKSENFHPTIYENFHFVDSCTRMCIRIYIYILIGPAATMMTDDGLNTNERLEREHMNV